MYMCIYLYIKYIHIYTHINMCVIYLYMSFLNLGFRCWFFPPIESFWEVEGLKHKYVR